MLLLAQVMIRLGGGGGCSGCVSCSGDMWRDNGGVVEGVEFSVNIGEGVDKRVLLGGDERDREGKKEFEVVGEEGLECMDDSTMLLDIVRGEELLIMGRVSGHHESAIR